MGHEAADAGLHNVDAAIHKVVDLRLLPDTHDPGSLSLHHSVAELVRRLDDPDGEVVLLRPVESHKLAEIDPCQEVGVCHDEFALQLRQRKGDRSCGPEWLLLAHVRDCHPETPPVTEVAFNQIGLVTDGEDDR